MACQIIISGISGIVPGSGQPPSKLEVTGTVTDCQKICVKVINTLNGTETSVLETENINPNGEWIILFDAANGDFTTGDFACSNVEKLVVEAFCCDEPTCGNSEAFDGLTCRADTDPCPSVNVEILSISQNCANDGKRLVSLRATVNNAPTPTIYEWDFGDGENSSSEVFSTNPVDIAHEYDASDPNNLSYVAEFRIVFPQGCPPGQVTVNLPHCQSEPCPDQISTEVRDALGNTVDIDQLACLDPGNYSVKVVQPSGSNLTFSWTINGTLQQGQTGSTLDVSVSAGQSLEINVAVVAPDCPPLADSVVLSGCQRCPDRARLAVLDPLGNTIDIDTEDCIPATKYSIVLVEPDAPEMQISWSVDGVLQPGFTTTEFSYDLSEGEVVEISVAVLIDGCPVLSDAITLVACDCPDETLGITVTDTAGNTVNTVGCVNSGVYFLEATGGDLENVDLQWSAGATPLGNGTQATITFDGSAIGGCCFLRTTPPSTTVTVTAANADPNCPDRSASVTLRGCRTDTFCIDCWLLRLAIIFFATISAMAAAVWICAKVVVNPLIPQTAGWAAIAVWVAPVVLVIAILITIAILLFWWWCCRPTWCDDWMVLLWQVLISAGFIFLYFGTCPFCALKLVPIGLLLFGSGVGVFIWWIVACRPSMCKIFFEIGSLGLVQLVVSWLEFIIGACVWAWGWLIMLIWNTGLNLVGWIGTVISCRVNPNR